MVLSHLMKGIEVTDQEFDAELYPEPIGKISLFHFTPIDIAIKAAQYLVNAPGVRVLDIGSGAGKFCIVGAVCTEGHFTGIEQRESFYDLSKLIAKKRKISNVDFIHANITTIDFSEYQAFYFYNSFYENLVTEDEMNDSIIKKRELYQTYSAYVKSQLDSMPIGTRLVTYFSSGYEVPESYRATHKFKSEKLTLWEKQV